ncbi:MAG: glycosyltransferase family 39 protein [Candidatus Methanofastidiosia archaeon]
MAWNLKRWEVYFLISIYLFCLAIRLAPKLPVDPHLPAFQGDVWYRICMAQYIFDHGRLPEPDIRYLSYGFVPMWYPPLSVTFLAALSKITTLDIPTVVTRVIPFFEALSPLSIYFLARYLYRQHVAVYSTIILAATSSFIYWTGIADPQSFLLFLIPLYVLWFIKYAKGEHGNTSLIIMGVILGISFLFHLSYFVLILVLFMVLVYLATHNNVRKPLTAFVVLVGLSQMVAFWWWFPRNLYWWWIKGLTSSSGYYTPLKHFFEFGAIPALLGAAGLVYLAVKRDKYFALLGLWILPLFLETQNETILQLIGHVELSWETLVKPLEGFRFYCFLAQPVSIAGGVLVWKLTQKIPARIVFSGVLVLLALNLWTYNIAFDLVNTGITRSEYDAAVWYRENSPENALIVADYYRAQMIAGVCGGKALLGGLFPLRNVDYPYIRAPGQVQDDLYTLYATEDIEEALQIINRYKITHVFYSRNLETTGYFGTYLQKEKWGLEIPLDKFFTEWFTVVYRDEDILIFKVNQ